MKIASAVQTSDEAEQLRQPHRLVQQQHAEQELDRRREVLQQSERHHRHPLRGRAEQQQRHGGHEPGEREQHRVAPALVSPNVDPPDAPSTAR